MLRPVDKMRYAPDTGAGGAGGGASPTGGTGGAGGSPATTGGAGSVGTQGGGAPGEGSPATWDAFLETLPTAAKDLHTAHESGLRNAVQATRQERDALKARLDAVIQGLDGKEPATVRQELQEMRSGLETANARADFFEVAAKPEVGCRNPKLAWMVAQAEKLFDRRGNPDWAAIKQAAPELFGPAVPSGHAGSGTGSTVQGKQSMDDIIRQRAGFT